LNLYNQKKVIYLISSPLSERDFKRYGIKNWIKHNWNVKILDFTTFLFPNISRSIYENKPSINFKDLVRFNCFHDVLYFFKNIEHKLIFIDLLGYSSKEQKIRNIINKYGLSVKLELGYIPFVNVNRNYLRLLKLIKNPIALIKKITSFIKNRIEKIRAKRHEPDYLVISGRKSIQSISSKKTCVIKAHNWDYDFIIEKKKIKSKKKSNFLVFLDEDGPYHSDFILSEIIPFVTAESYYPIVDFGLTRISKILKLDVKIAAHPKSNYKNKKIKYNHKIIENKTFELIKKSKVVVAHFSTAVQWAVILKKPIIFVTTDEIQNNYYAKTYLKNINNFATILGSKVINLSNIEKINNLQKYLSVDLKKYDKYIENYVKMKDTPKKLSWDILIQKIQKDLSL
jgi:hypothetical protein